MLIEIKDSKMANANSLCKLLAKEVCNYFYFILAKEKIILKIFGKTSCYKILIAIYVK